MDTIAILREIATPFSLHPYIFIFIGLFFFGETVFFPALYLAFRGKLQTTVVIELMVAATILSDFVWYMIGRSFPKETAMKLIGSRAARSMEQLSTFFDAHRLKTLYLSKFVYGTRTVVQVLSGMHKTPFGRYMFVNILGISTLAVVILLLAYLTHSTVEALSGTVHALEVGFLVLILVLALIYIVIRQSVIRQWFQQ